MLFYKVCISELTGWDKKCRTLCWTECICCCVFTSLATRCHSCNITNCMSMKESCNSSIVSALAIMSLLLQPTVAQTTCFIYIIIKIHKRTEISSVRGTASHCHVLINGSSFSEQSRCMMDILVVFPGCHIWSGWHKKSGSSLSVRQQLISCPGSSRVAGLSQERASEFWETHQSGNSCNSTSTWWKLFLSSLCLFLHLKHFVCLSFQTGRAWSSIHLYSHRFRGLNRKKWVL